MQKQLCLPGTSLNTVTLEKRGASDESPCCKFCCRQSNTVMHNFCLHIPKEPLFKPNTVFAL